MIRLFSLSDMERILQIERQSFPRSPYDPATFTHLRWLYPDTFWVYVGREQGVKENRILGYIVFSREGHIISIAVDPKHRRKGVGKDLLEKAIETLRSNSLWAEVRKSNRGAQAFYLRLGFQITAVVPNYYGNEDALIVQWTAPASGAD